MKLAMIIKDGMVLQQGKKVPVFGEAAPGSTVKVSIQGKTYVDKTGEGGKFKVLCGPLEVSFGEDMTIEADGEKVTLKDVQVGEVWLAGGQSNMEFHMRYDADMKEEVKVCDNKNIRFFDYPEVSYPEQINDADYSKCYGFWRKADAEDLERFSAVGYYFAKEINKKLNVPIGIVGCNWGGTPACTWMSKEAILEGGGKVWLDEYDKAVEGLDLDDYNEKFKHEKNNAWNMDLLDNPISDLLMFGVSFMDLPAKLAEKGIEMPKDMGSFKPLIGPKWPHRPSGLYESMLKQVHPYGIRGVIWYQGETDGDTHSDIYKTMFPALIKNWRELWGEELPFLFVQIAGLGAWGMTNGEKYTPIRDAQQYTEKTVPGTGMAVITDVGMEHDIHPKRKREVGERLAYIAENKVYGDNSVEYMAPTLVSAAAEEGKLTLTFDNAGSGLRLFEKTPYGENLGKNYLSGLTVYEGEKEIDTSSLKAETTGNKVTLTGTAIKSGTSYKVGIARRGWHMVNLYNSANLPARPAEVTTR